MVDRRWFAVKRWKAASQGVEPLRALEEAREAQEAREALYVSAVGISDAARRLPKSIALP